MTTITVDPNTNLQTMVGWSATAQAGHDNNATTDTYEYPSTTFANYKAALLAAAVDLGLNRVRLEARADDANAGGVFWSGSGAPPAAIQPSTATAGQWWIDERIGHFMDTFGLDWKAELQARGEDLFVTICLVDFQNGGYHLEDSTAEFAFWFNYVATWFFNTYGFRPNAFEVLEPDNSNGNQNWTPAKLANGIIAANTLLVSNGHTGIKWVVPSVTVPGNVNTWIADMKTAQPTITDLILEYSYHLYDMDDAAIATLKTTALADGKTTFMSESHAGFGGASADHMRLYTDLTVGHGSSWEQFTLAFPWPGQSDNGGSYFFVDISTWAVTLNARPKYLMHWFKYVRNGAIRKAVSNVGGAGLGIPFCHPNGKYVVVVKYTGSDSTVIAGLPAGTYGIRYTTGDGTTTPSAYDQTIANQTITAGQNVSFSMPGQGVATVFDVDYLTPPPSGPIITGGRSANRILFAR